MEAGKKAAGFVTDFDSLLQQLKTEGYPQKYQYSEFCRKWQDLNFWKLFNGRKSESDKADFVDSCYHIVVQFFMLPRCGTHVKTVCIFVLFALYTGQACISKRRIRLTYSEFLRIFEFCSDGYENNMTEPYSIFWQLHHLGAFDYTVTQTPKLLGTSDTWYPKINSDEASPALANVVKKVPAEFEKSLALACTSLRVTFDAYKSTMERFHEMTPPQIELIDFQAVSNPVDRIDMERQIILDRRAQFQQDAETEVREEENSIFSRRQRIRRSAQTAQVSSCVVQVGGELVLHKKRGEKKAVVRQHRPEETFNQRHLVETQHLFPKGNRSIYPSKDLVELANTTKIKRGRPFVVDVERRVIQKGKRGQWHRREDKLQEEPDSDDNKTEDEEQNNEAIVEENLVDKNAISVKGSIQLAIKTTRDKLRNDMERKERMEELDKERKELEAAREKGVDEMSLLQREREMKKKQKIIDLMSEARKKNPNVGRPRKVDPRKEDVRAKPKAKTRMQQRRKLEDDLKKAQEKREKEEQRKIARIEKQAIGVKRKRIVKTAEEREEAKRIREEKKAKKIRENEIKAAKRAEKAKKAPKTPPHLDWYKLKVGNFFEIQDQDAETPVLVKINWIDETREEIRGNYWDICPGEAGMALYERTWKRRDADEDEVEEYLFCIEDFAQKVSMRNVQRPGVHTVSGVKLTSKSASLMAPRYSMFQSD